MQPVLSILQNSVSIGFMEPGSSEKAPDGWIHKKRAPCTIIAQATLGAYEVHSDGYRTMATGGEAFLARDGQFLEITHHAARRGGLMRARWLHVRFQVFTTVDLVSLLALPPKTDVTFGRRFGTIIAELLEMRADGPQSLAGLARRQELGFQALRLLCELAPLSTFGEAFLHQADRLAPVLSFIRTHLREPLSVEMLAHIAHLSRSRFHAFFLEHMGRAPMDYVKSVRLSEARLRLITTQETVYRIAELTGFSNPYHFSREFKRLYGCTPRDFRGQHTALQV